MEQILFNLANIHLMNFCKENNIDCSGSHVQKLKRKFNYNLLSSSNELIASITFHKNQIPTYQLAK